MPMQTIDVGTAVTLYPLTGGRPDLPAENPRLYGVPGTVVAVAAWGAFVQPATGGLYRAGADEMRPVGANGEAPKVLSALTGDVCQRCGSGNMTRAGTCLLCLDCGDTSGGCG